VQRMVRKTGLVAKKAGFCWNVGGWQEAKLDYLVGSRLSEDYGLTGHYVVMPSERSYEALSGCKNVTRAPNFFCGNLPALKKVHHEHELELPEGVTLELLRFSDLVLREMPRERAFDIICAYLSFWEDFFLRHSEIKFIVTYATGGIIGRTAFCVGKRLGISYLTVDVVFQRGIISDINEDHTNKKLVDIYARKKSAGLKDAEKKEVEEYTNSFKNRGKMLYKPNRPTGNIQRRANTLLGLLGFDEKCPWREPRRIIRNYAKNTFRYFLGRYAMGYDKVVPGEKFVFFPLHLVLDMQVLVRSPFYFNQAELINSISLSLPEDVRLYVKEHPSEIGNTPLEQIKKIKNMGKVRLLDPATNSHDLIKNADAVITIASTTGWEAFLYKKPVITFGNTFYAYSDLVYKVRNINDLPRIMKDALQHKDIYEKRVDLWQAFISSLLDASFPSNPVIYIYNDEALNRKESKSIADALHDAYQYGSRK